MYEPAGADAEVPDGEASVARRGSCSRTTTTESAQALRVGEDGGAMRSRQEDVEQVTVGVERRRVGARLRGDRLETPHGADVDHIDHAGIAHRDIAAREGVVEEDDVGRSGQRYRRQRLARGGVHG